MMRTPEWWHSLRALREEAGNPSLRTLAEMTGISHTQIGAVFQGTSTPGKVYMRKLVFALTQDPEVRDTVMTEYRRDVLMELDTRSAGEPSADARHIAEAIVQAAQILADALKERPARPGPP